MDNPSKDPLQTLLTDLMAWRDGEDLQPFIDRTVALCGPSVLKDLPTDRSWARSRLIDAVEEKMQA